MLPAFLTAENLDFDSKEKNRDLHISQPGKTDCVLFGSDNHFEITTNTTGDETLDLGFAIAMMIGVAFGQLDPSPQFAEAGLEAFRSCDPADRSNIGAAQTV